MDRSVKLFIIVLTTIFAVIGLCILLIDLLNKPLFPGLRDALSVFESAHSDEDIIRYLKEEHNIKVRVVENWGPKNVKKSGNSGAIVETVGKEKLEFDVFINSFGAISGDNYEYKKAVKELNVMFKKSTDLKKLKQNGYLYAYFESMDTSSNIVNFTLTIPRDLAFYDHKTITLVDTAISTMNNWEETINQYGLILEELTILKNHSDSHILIDLNKPYKSIDELGMNLAVANIDIFAEQFIYEDNQKIESIDISTTDLALQSIPMQPATYLRCEYLIAIDECGSYSISITYKEQEQTKIESISEFRYDNPEVKNDLFTLIKIIKDIDLPIDKVIINHLYTPSNLDNQIHTEKEFEELGIYESLSPETVVITNLQDILSKDDIYFESH